MSHYGESPHGELACENAQCTREQAAALLDLNPAELYFTPESIVAHAMMQRGPDRFPFLSGMS